LRLLVGIRRAAIESVGGGTLEGRGGKGERRGRREGRGRERWKGGSRGRERGSTFLAVIHFLNLGMNGRTKK
jgi:hypothetical protein